MPMSRNDAQPHDEDYSDVEMVRKYTYPCGCVIWGKKKSAKVEQVWLCKAHESLADTAAVNAPFSFKKMQTIIPKYGEKL